ncbi:hypothetical protein P171DRAFT_480583 [Karstenula rhodostoma CBS 690.94]|uniref:C3H1-type domain-containing protein n=1 Tax=Karstenula rhodostoma CBS 690.94 TaxID=1392251 RepID=A0A9P4PV61_9PLEO|nr:hypothetical protein P171DRAFT_480583 [Karstenula rhodostoma CBS 690.94]
MAVHTEAIYSPSALPETVRYYIERIPGNIPIPLIPVDQLPFQPQGIPSQLSKQQISEENWQRVTGVTETATLLPAQLLTPQGTFTVTPTFPTHRAPDYNVKKNVAIQVSEKDSVPELCPVYIHPTTRVEQRESKHQRHSTRNDEDADTQLTPEAVRTEPFPIDQRSRAMTTRTHGDRSSKSMTQTQTNKYVTPLRSAPLPDLGHDVIARDAGNGTAPKTHAENPHSLYSRVDNCQSVAKDYNGDKLWLPGPRAFRTRSNYPPKIYCDYWIRTGECAWGERCEYKHVMPPLDVLVNVTGFRKIPQWYKEQTAIQSRGPTWVERNMQAKKQNAGHGDDMDKSGPREFPDPSMLKRLRRERDGDAKQNVPANRVFQDLIDLNPSTLPADPVDPAEPASAVTQIPTPATTPTGAKDKRGAQTILRRNSQISSSSGTTSSSQTMTQPHKFKSSKKAKQNSASQPKWGLAASKYAPENERVDPNSCRTVDKTRHRRHNKNSTREEGHLTENAGTGQRAATETYLL